PFRRFSSSKKPLIAKDSPDYPSSPTFRQANSTHRSLNTEGENRLKLRVLFLSRDHAHFDVAKTRVFEQLMQFSLAKTEPAVGIKLARFLEAVTQQIEHNDTAVLFQHATRRGDCPLRLDRVMQRLAQQNKVDTFIRDRRIFQVAQPVLDIFETVFLRKLRTELDHLRRIIDRDNFARALGQQLGKGSFACAKIDNSQSRNERDQRVRERSPRTPRDVAPTELAGQFVEILTRFVLAFAQRELQGRSIARGLGNFARENLDHLLHATASTIPAGDSSRAVVNIFS